MSLPTSTASRFDVQSPDGTSIAVFVEGQGPPIAMVHGALADHTRFGPLVEELRSTLTTYCMDRRGRGASGDAPAYSIEREFEDVAAVVDRVAADTGGPVAVWGHSYGADCALGAAALTSNISHLLLYEPGLGFQYPPGSVESVKKALDAGDVEGGIVALLAGVLNATDEEIAAMKASPLWPSRLATVPTMPRELDAEQTWAWRPGQFDAATAPALLLAGSESPPEQTEATRRAAEALPNARIHVLEGQGHFAIQSDPALVARLIRDFVLT